VVNQPGRPTGPDNNKRLALLEAGASALAMALAANGTPIPEGGDVFGIATAKIKEGAQASAELEELRKRVAELEAAAPSADQPNDGEVSTLKARVAELENEVAELKVDVDDAMSEKNRLANLLADQGRSAAPAAIEEEAAPEPKAVELERAEGARDVGPTFGSLSADEIALAIEPPARDSRSRSRAASSRSSIFGPIYVNGEDLHRFATQQYAVAPSIHIKGASVPMDIARRRAAARGVPGRLLHLRSRCSHRAWSGAQVQSGADLRLSVARDAGGGGNLSAGVNSSWGGFNTMAEQAAAASLDTDTVQLILSNHERLKERRAFYESTWREIDRYVDPHGAGGWDQGKPTFSREVDDLFDVTALDGLDRYTAAIAGITIPRQQRWHGVAFADKDLMKLPSVRRWCAHATDRLFTARYAPGTGFEAQAHEDIRQEGKYGTSAMWVGEVVGKGLFYKTLHMSEIYIDEDYSGRVDTVHRAYVCTIRNAAAEFGVDNLSDKSRGDYEDPKKRNNEIEILHVIRPNRDFEPGYLGPKGKPIESLYIEVAEKHVIRRAGFRTMPIPVSRHVTGPRDVYGRSPAMKVLATVKGLNAMARTILDAANKAVDPPLLYADDADISKVVTKPGGLTAGGVDERGAHSRASAHDRRPAPGRARDPEQRARRRQASVPRRVFPAPVRSFRSHDGNASDGNAAKGGRAHRSVRWSPRNREARAPDRARARYHDERAARSTISRRKCSRRARSRLSK
jgi:hypothetical protein